MVTNGQMNLKYHFILGLSFVLFSFVYSQNTNEEAALDSLIRNEGIIELNETAVYTVNLKDKANSQYYSNLKKKLIIPYQYAKECALIYKELVDSVNTITNKSAKRKFLRKSKKELDEEFRKTFIKMSRWQGEIFIKLIHKNTRKTVSDIIKENSGKFALLVFEAKAGLFGLELDSKYDPVNIREDKFLEVAIAEMVGNGKLTPILLGDKPKYKLGQKKTETNPKKSK